MPQEGYSEEIDPIENELCAIPLPPEIGIAVFLFVSFLELFVCLSMIDFIN